jgi:hypothetical protein
MEYGYEDGAVGFTIHQRLQLLALAGLAFMIPFTLGHPQQLVGVLVNALIIRAALTLPRDRALPVAFAPTLGVLARGLLFGPFTFYVALMMPLIWAGNYILLWAFSLRGNYALTLGLSSLAKAAFLYSGACALYGAGLMPAALLPAMGAFQLATAVAGGVLAYCELKAERILFR